MERHTNNILVPIDFSEKSISALEQSFILAKLIDLEITLLHVIQDSGFNFFASLFSEDQNAKKQEIRFDNSYNGCKRKNVFENT